MLTITFVNQAGPGVCYQRFSMPAGYQSWEIGYPLAFEILSVGDKFVEDVVCTVVRSSRSMILKGNLEDLEDLMVFPRVVRQHV